MRSSFAHALIVALCLAPGCGDKRDEPDDPFTDDDTDVPGTGTGTTFFTTGTATGEPFVPCAEPFALCGDTPDPSGMWDIAAMCDPGLRLEALSCPEAVVTVTEDRGSGDAALEGSGYRFYRFRYNIDVDYTLDVPESCMAEQTCDALATLLADQVATCADDGSGGCTCTGTRQRLEDVTGTWAMNGVTLVVDGSDTTEVCVEGDVVRSRDFSGTYTVWTRQ